jgi:hypothetical protein
MFEARGLGRREAVSGGGGSVHWLFGTEDAGPMRAEEGGICPHHERIWCCMWLIDHYLITRLAANISYRLEAIA